MIFTKTSSQDMVFATNKEIENKLGVAWKLADALAQDFFFSDTSISLEERSEYLEPYNRVYGLFLMGITDKEGKIISAYDKETVPAGALIMSIPFDGLNKMITNVAHNSNFMFTLLGSDHKVMAEKEADLIATEYF